MKFINAFVLFFALPLCAFAQYPSENQQAMQTDTLPGNFKKNIERSATEKMTKLDSVVHLTAQQKKELKPVYVKVELQRYRNNQTTHDKVTIDQLNNKAEIEKWNAWHKYLTPAQVKKWEAYRKANANGEY